MRTTAFLAEQRQIVAELDALRAEAGALKRLRILLDQGIPVQARPLAIRPCLLVDQQPATTEI